MRLARYGVLLLSAAGLATACGGGGQDDANLTRAETAHVRLGFPKDWQRQDEKGHFAARKSAGGKTVAQVVVLERAVKASTADLAVDAMQAGRAVQPNFQRGKLETIKVKGTKEARRLTYSYTSTEGSAQQPATGTDVVALLDRDAYVVRITGLQGQLAQSDVDAIVSSIELKEG
ncbi:hypothetical protein [Actinomadura hibisca]|uniref:hypothetical protein n=1 Tax=Actinomadura hibisca TaxID=68565 RepID=UPI000AE8FEAD|nr:hypothetical protein [Actinomadura hibisca]